MTGRHEARNALARVLIVLVARPVRDQHASPAERLAFGSEVLGQYLEL
jgi:hypothetical protein